MKTKTLSLVLFALLICFTLTLGVEAVVPPPDGGYPGGNTAEGTNALLNLTSGINNTAVGANALHDNTTGGYNVGIGSRALASNTTGDFNMAIGTEALTNNNANYNLAVGFRVGFNNTTGHHLTGIGAGALFSNTTGSFNTALGADALDNNTHGDENTAIGYQALFNNIWGNKNTAIGYRALFSYSGSGGDNTAIGDEALFSNTNGTENTAIGEEALFFNTTGLFNTAIGYKALFHNRGEFPGGNTAIGAFALEGNTTGTDNTAIGPAALASNTTGSDNVAVGYRAGLNVGTARNVICIGAEVRGADVSNTTCIGNIYGVTTQNAMTAPVIVSADGQLGTVASSERFKNDIATMEKASEAILSLRPVTFHYKTDTKNTPQFGLIAEEVAKVNPALVLPDKEGKPHSVRYDAVNAMLLNEFLKEHRTVQEQKATIAQLKEDFQSKLTEQQKQIQALTVGLQKVSAQLELSKPAPQTVENTD
jgi:trimeric autotransporter adhesin